MNKNDIEEIQAKIILDDLEQKRKIEKVAKQTINEYYFEDFKKVIFSFIPVATYICISLYYGVDEDIVFFSALFGVLGSEIIRLSNKLDAVVKLQEINNKEK
ncbi:MAG: hypothetical protein MJA31_18705 [Clostridia bacterium]|nr:hypothetical protein [Clostridia bacterium]